MLNMVLLGKGDVLNSCSSTKLLKCNMVRSQHSLREVSEPKWTPSPSLGLSFPGGNLKRNGGRGYLWSP